MSGQTGPGHASHSTDRGASFSPRDRARIRIRVRDRARIRVRNRDRNRNRARIRNRNRNRVRVRIRIRDGGKIPILREKSLHPRRILEKSLPRRSWDEDAFERRA